MQWVLGLGERFARLVIAHHFDDVDQSKSRVPLTGNGLQVSSRDPLPDGAWLEFQELRGLACCDQVAQMILQFGGVERCVGGLGAFAPGPRVPLARKHLASVEQHRSMVIHDDGNQLASCDPGANSIWSHIEFFGGLRDRDEP